MKNKVVYLLQFIFTLGLIFIGPKVIANTLSIDSQGNLGPGIQYQTKGNISSIDDIDNGNLTTILNVSNGESPKIIKNLLLDGPIQITSQSSFSVNSGEVALQGSQDITFSFEKVSDAYPSFLITDVGKTQSGTILDALVKVENIRGMTIGKSSLRFVHDNAGALAIEPTDLGGVDISYQFQNHETHGPVNLFMLPVLGDIDWGQQTSINGKILGYGSNISSNSEGLLTSNDTGTNGLSDFPLGGVLYAFYGNTLTSTFNTKSDGTVDSGTPGFDIFGAYGNVKNIELNYPKSQVNFHYLDSLSKANIQSSSSITGQIFNPFNFDAPIISNYQLANDLSQAHISGQYTANQQDVNLYYDKASEVTVNLLDAETGKTIQSPKILKGYARQSYSISPSTLSNYRLDTKKTNKSLAGNYGNSDKVVNLYYDQASSVTFNLMNGSQLLSSHTLTGYSGDTFTYIPPFLTNFRRTQTPQKGLYKNASQTIVIPYQVELGNLTINYINTVNNQTLLPSLSLDNKVGDNTILRVPYLSNYHQVDGSPVTIKQLLPTQAQNIYYEPNRYQLVVNFLDQDGHSLQKSLLLSNYFGFTTSFEAPPIKGYELADGQVQNLQILTVNPVQVLNIHYQPDTGSEHFIFEDEKGKQVAEPQTISGKNGTTFNFVAPYVKYLHLTNSNQALISGKYTAQKNTRVIKYTHLQAKLDVYGIDDRGNVLRHITMKGVEGQSYGIIMPGYWNLKMQNSKYQRFTGIYNSQNKVIVVLYRHVATKLKVNLRVDGQIKSSFTVNGIPGNHFSMKVPTLHQPFLTGGTNTVSGTYTQVNQTYNVDYHYTQSRISFNLYDSAGDYISSHSISGEYGQHFNYSLPSAVYDNYGNVYYAQFNRNLSGYFGSQNESHDVVYQYTGPHGSYVSASYQVPKENNEVFRIKLSDIKAENANFNLLVKHMNAQPDQLRLQLLSNNGVVYVGGKRYLRGYTIDAWGNTVLVLTPVQNNPTPPPAPSSKSKSSSSGIPSDINPGYIYQSASRDFWVWTGTTWVPLDYTSMPEKFSMSMVNGGWHFYDGVNTNESRKEIDKSQFQNYLEQTGIYGLMIVQNLGTVATEEIPGVDVITTGADVTADGEEIAELSELQSEGEIESETVDLDVKPDVSNNKLQNIVNDLYKGQGGDGSSGTIGNGTTMDAVRNEQETGESTYGKFHTEKLENYERALQKRLRAGDLDGHDTAVAQAILRDIQDVLGLGG